MSGETVVVSPSPTDTPSPTATPTQKPAAQREQSGGANPAPTDPPAPTAATTQAPPPVTAAGAYCSTISATSPPNTVIGLLNAPAGTSVSLAFDGLVGPTARTAAAGGYRVDYGAGGADCANRVGAAISVVVNGRFYNTGQKVGDSPGRPVRFDIPAD